MGVGDKPCIGGSTVSSNVMVLALCLRAPSTNPKRRGNRGRGNRSLHSSSVNDDRDGDSNLFYRKNSRGKIYEKSSESADNHAGQEEGRIGRQLRLLSREINEDNIVKICHQLQVTVLVFHIIIKSS